MSKYPAGVAPFPYPANPTAMLVPTISVGYIHTDTDIPICDKANCAPVLKFMYVVSDELGLKKKALPPEIPKAELYPTVPPVVAGARPVMVSFGDPLSNGK